MNGKKGLWRRMAAGMLTIAVLISFASCAGEKEGRPASATAGQTAQSSSQAEYTLPDMSGLPQYQLQAKTLKRDTGVTDNGEPVYAEYKLAEENQTYELYFSENRLDIVLVHKPTGTIGYSNATMAELIQGGSSVADSKINSVTVNYVNKLKNSYELGSSRKCVSAKKYIEDYTNYDKTYKERFPFEPYYITENEKGGLRVIYVMGEIRPDYDIPAFIPIERFEECLQIINERYGLVAKMVMNSNYKLVNMKVMQEKDNDDLPNRIRKEYIRSNIPELDRLITGIYKDGIYALNSESMWDNLLLPGKIEMYLQKGGLTSEEIARYNELAGFTGKFNKDLIILPLDYELSEDGLRVSVDESEIKYDPSIIGIRSIEIMQNFQSTADGGSGYTVNYDEYSATVTFGSLSQAGA